MSKEKDPGHPQHQPAKRQATPPTAAPNMRSDGLVIRVGVNGMETSDALKVATDAIVDSLDDQWTVEPMGQQSRDFIARRVTTEKNPTATEAFEMARQLQLHGDVEDCEPSLYLPGGAPESMRNDFEELQLRSLRSSSSSSSSGGSSPLPCSVSSDWSLRLTGAQDAWALPLPTGGKSRGEGITIGHPDTGYTSHPQLDPTRVLVSRGRDFEEGNADPRDNLTGNSAGHGTSTGSVIMSGEDAQVTGIAPRAQLVPLRVTTSVVLFSFGKLAEAIRFAADDGQHVISISLGGPLGSRFLTRAVRYALDRGVIVIAAAGNVWPFVVYPAKLDEVIAVAACNCQHHPWSRSASGHTVDITAPGESVWRALADENGFSTGQSSGTSYATATTAGAAALWLAHHGRDALISRYGQQNIAAAFREVLTTAGFDRPSGWDTENFGPGILNIKKLLSAPLPRSAPTIRRRSSQDALPPQINHQLDEITDLFPTTAPSFVRSGLSQLLRTDDAGLEKSLRTVGDEIAYHAVMDLAFRQQFVQRISTSARSTQATAANENANLEKKNPEAIRAPEQMSPTLKKMVSHRAELSQ